MFTVMLFRGIQEGLGGFRGCSGRFRGCTGRFRGCTGESGAVLEGLGAVQGDSGAVLEGLRVVQEGLGAVQVDQGLIWWIQWMYKSVHRISLRVFRAFRDAIYKLGLS